MWIRIARTGHRQSRTGNCGPTIRKLSLSSSPSNRLRVCLSVPRMVSSSWAAAGCGGREDENPSTHRGRHPGRETPTTQGSRVSKLALSIIQDRSGPNHPSVHGHMHYEGVRLSCPPRLGRLRQHRLERRAMPATVQFRLSRCPVCQSHDEIPVRICFRYGPVVLAYYVHAMPDEEFFVMHSVSGVVSEGVLICHNRRPLTVAQCHNCRRSRPTHAATLPRAAIPPRAAFS